MHAIILFTILSLTTASFAQPQGKIVFQSDRDGDRDIYVMNPDGSDLIQLTHNETNDYFPVWSPDGSQIAFYSIRDGNRQIYVMNADGSNQVRLTTRSDIQDGVPSWSPDGSQIAFLSGPNVEWARSELYLMNADGSNQRPLAQAGQRLAWERPSWSPDGTKILVTSEPEGPGNQRKIYELEIASGQFTSLSPEGNPVLDIAPVYSPDGTRIVFSTARDASGVIYGDLYLMNADGTGRTRLQNARGFAPAWSPDGNYITYNWQLDYPFGRAAIWVMASDGSNPQVLTEVSENWTPHWLPASSSQRTAIEASSWGWVKRIFR